MKVEFICKGIPPISLNDAYTKDRQKTPATFKWLWELKTEMLKEKGKIDAIKKYFRRDKHYFLIDYVWLMPEEMFFTEEGHISRATHDWSNLPKVPDDLVFMELFRTDDAYACKGSVLKIPYKKDFFSVIIKIEIKNLNNLQRDFEHEVPECLR